MAQWFPATDSDFTAADFINSELWSSAVTVEMNGRDERALSLSLLREGYTDGRQDAITVLSIQVLKTRGEGRSFKSSQQLASICSLLLPAETVVE